MYEMYQSMVNKSESTMVLLYGLNRFHAVSRIKVEGSWLIFEQLHRFWTIL